MIDPNPLLPESESAASSSVILPQPESSASPTPRSHLSLDDAMETFLGDSHRTQLLQSTISSFAWFFDAQQTFISIFTDAEPKWSCRNPSCNSSSNICRLPKDSWSWDLPVNTSIISEWSLKCAGSIITGLPASSFFLGCLTGGLLLATLADSSLGRKKMLVLCCLAMSVPGALTAFAPNVWIYCGLRFLSGFGRATIGTNAFVHASELVGRKWRDKIGVIGFIFYNFGFLSLPIIAFQLRGCSWRLMYLFTSVPCVIYSILLYFSVHESPRWLFVKGRKQEFLKTLRSMAARDKHSSLTESSCFLADSIMWEEKSEEKSSSFYSTIQLLLKKSWAFKRLLVVMAMGFSLSLTYYGMPLGLGNLPFNLYLSVTFNALSELAASLITFFMIAKLKRKGCLFGLSLLSGICSIASVFVGSKGVQLALEIVSFFGACTAYNVLVIYLLELFPTCVRNSAMGMVREALLLGGVVGPVAAAVGRGNGLFLSYGLFGVMACLCGVVVALLPETKGRVLIDTMEEEESMYIGRGVKKEPDPPTQHDPPVKKPG